MSEQYVPVGPSMLLRFAADNVRSFRRGFDLSLQATTLAEPDVVRSIPWSSAGSLVDVLPAVGIFGANASGKSNLLASMADMRNIVAGSFRFGSADTPIPRVPFLGIEDSAQVVSRYEIEAVIDGVKHEYGFECTNDTFLSEWAFHYPNGRRALLFERVDDAIKLGAEDRSRGNATSRILRSNALFVSTGDATQFEPAVRIARWMRDNLLFAEARNRELRNALTVSMLQNSETRNRVLGLLQAADIGITDAHVLPADAETQRRHERAIRVLEGLDPDDDSLELSQLVEIELVHAGAESPFSLNSDAESLGTIVWLGLIGPIIQALDQGSVLLLDELDSSLHPVLVREMIRLFQDPTVNTRRAQLIFNAFDISVLSGGEQRLPLGRDQVWFTDKTMDGSSRLYALTDFSPRKDQAFGERYLRGLYGAIPIVSEAEFDAALDFEHA